MANQIDLTTVALVASTLSINPATASLPRIVTASSRVISRHVGYDMYFRSTSETVASIGWPYLFLGAGQINSITSIQIDGANIDSSLYAIDNTLMGRIRGKGISFPFRGMALGITYTPIHAVPDVVVSYSAGWVTPGQNAIDAVTYPSVTLPEDIQEAAIQVAVSNYRRLGTDADIESFSLGDSSISMGERSPIPREARLLLRPYKKLVRRLF